MAKGHTTSITSNPPAKRRKRRSSAKYRCPSLLAEWLERLSAFDPHVDYLGLITDPAFAEALGLKVAESKIDLDQKFAALCEEVSQNGRLGDLNPPSELLAVGRKRLVNSFLEFCVVGYGLRKIAEHYAGKGAFPPLVLGRLEEEPGTTKLNSAPTGLGEVIRGAECERIRICEECSHLFWGKRKESKTCSTKCRNVVTVRAHRERMRAMTDEEKAEWKRRRDKNRNYKQKLRKLRKKKSAI